MNKKTKPNKEPTIEGNLIGYSIKMHSHIFLVSYISVICCNVP